MTVIRLVKSSNKETVSVLKCLLDKAIDGQLISLAGSFEFSNGTEESVFTGRYKADPKQALSAAMSLSWKITQLQNEGASL